MSVTINDVTYVGGIEAVNQKGQPSFGMKKKYEPDSATLTMQGAPDYIQTFMDALTRGQAMSYLDGTGSTVTLTNMWLVDATRSDNATYPEATLNFMGVIDELPETQIEDSLATTNVSTTALITDPADPLYTADAGTPTTKLSLNLEYRAARTTYSWYDTTTPDPNTPQFSSVSNQSNPLDRVVRGQVTGINQPGAQVNTLSLSEMIVLTNSLTAQERIDDYKIEQPVPGKLWRCNVCAQYALVGQ